MKWRKSQRSPLAQVEVKLATVPCAFCKGTGRDPFHLMSDLSNCPVCNGRKTVRIREPYQTCPACGGSGRYPPSRLYCWTCRGKGVIAIKQEPQAAPAPAGED